MIEYTVYDTASGRIIRTGSALTEATAQLQASAPGTSVRMTGSDPVTEVIQPGSGTIINKQAMRNGGGGLTGKDKNILLANGQDMLTIYNIPDGASYSIVVPSNQGITPIPDGLIGPDGQLLITTTVPGGYDVTLRYANFLDFKVTFDAN